LDLEAIPSKPRRVFAHVLNREKQELVVLAGLE